MYQGVNPNRGLEGSVIDTDRDLLAQRMRDYFGAKTFAEVSLAHPGLAEKYAGYDAERVWDELRAHGYDDRKIVSYVMFPLDVRWLYYELRSHLLNRPRPELAATLRSAPESVREPVFMRLAA